MKHLYFVCMNNYYRSRLAEELARHYAKLYDLEIAVDSGGLAEIPNPVTPGNISKVTLQYLGDKNILPQGSDRQPKHCSIQEIDQADIVVCTDQDEQFALFKKYFPDYRGELIGWRMRDQQYDSGLSTPDLINQNVEALIKQLAGK